MFALLFVGLNGAYGQTPFEGSINYNISLTGDDAEFLLQNNPAKKMTFHLKDDNFIVHLYEARIPRTFLFIGDSNHTYVVDAAESVYYLRDYYRDTTGFIPKAKLIKETAEVRGIACKVYQAKFPDMIVEYYVTPLYVADTSLYAVLNEAKADFLIPGLGGMIPMKKIIREKGITTTLEMTSIVPAELGIENFRIPRSFVRKKRDHRQ